MISISYLFVNKGKLFVTINYKTNKENYLFRFISLSWIEAGCDER